MSQSSNILSFVSATNSEPLPRANSTDSTRSWPAPATSETDETLQRIAEAALSATSASGAALALRNGEAVVCLARAGAMAPPLGAKLDDTSGISSECLRTGEALRCDDTVTDTRVDADACRSLGLRSLAVAPIKNGALVLGILEVFSPHPNAFTDRHMDVLRQLAELVQETSGEQQTERLLDPAHRCETGTDPAAEAVTTPLAPPLEPENHPQEIELQFDSALVRPSDVPTPFSHAPFLGGALASPSLREPTVIEPTSPSPGDVNIAAYMAAHEYAQSGRHSRTTYVALIGLATVLFASAFIGWWLGHRAPNTVALQPPPAAVTTPQNAGTSSTAAPLAVTSAAPPQVLPGTQVSSRSQSSQFKRATSTQESVTKAASLDRIANTPSEITKPIRVVTPSVINPSDGDSAPGIALISGDSKSSETISSLITAPIPLPQRTLPISQGVVGGGIEHRVDAIYPSQARSLRQEGTVVLDALIAEDGSVRDLSVVSGPPLLRKAASDAVKQWKYKPFRLNGQPVPMKTQVKIAFKLQ